jgi:hypothetical protein
MRDFLVDWDNNDASDELLREWVRALSAEELRAEAHAVAAAYDDEDRMLTPECASGGQARRRHQWFLRLQCIAAEIGWREVRPILQAVRAEHDARPADPEQ